MSDWFSSLGSWVGSLFESDPYTTKSPNFGISSTAEWYQYTGQTPATNYINTTFDSSSGVNYGYLSGNGNSSNMFAEIAGSVAQGIGSALQRHYASQQYGIQADIYEYQARGARAQQKLAKINIANAYRSGEYEAMVTGLRNAQQIANARNSRSASGTQLNSGSNVEVEASNRASARQDYYAINQNMINNVISAQRELVSAQIAENTALANAKAADILGDALGGTKMGIFQFMTWGGAQLNQAGSAYMSNGFSGFSSFSGFGSGS